MTSLSESDSDGKSVIRRRDMEGFQKVSRSNSRLNALDTLVVTVHSIIMPVVFGRCAMKTRGKPLSIMAYLKRSFVEVIAEQNYLSHAFVIRISRLGNDPKYNSYRSCCMIRPVVQHLFKTTGIDLTNNTGIPELVRFKEHCREDNIVDYHGLSCKAVMFEGHVNSSKRIKIIYDDVERHYPVIANLISATARRYVSKECNKSCTIYVTHAYDRTFSDFIACPPCALSVVRIPCFKCKRRFGIRNCYDKCK